MQERTARWAWHGGSLVGAMVARGLCRAGYERPCLIATGATAVWFLAWLARDNLLFKKEVAEQQHRLAERRAAVRAAKEARAAEQAALRRGQSEPGRQ